MTEADRAPIYYHGAGSQLRVGTRLRPSPDGHIYATTDYRMAESFAFRNAVHEWMQKGYDTGSIRRGRPMPPRPVLTGWVVELAVVAPPQQDPDFPYLPSMVRFPKHAKVTVARVSAPGSISSWRTSTSITGPHGLFVNGQCPYDQNGFMRPSPATARMGYTDADFAGLGPWFPVQGIVASKDGTTLAAFDEEILIAPGFGPWVELPSIAASGTSQAHLASRFWR